jgi:large subunit ribosomal protein L22
MAVQSVSGSQAFAKLKFARVGPRKLRRVADAIRGKRVDEALVILQFADVFAAKPLERLLRSAVANAENNHDMGGETLYVTQLMVDGGPGGTFTKRLDPRARGSANFKRKRMSHVTIAVGTTPPKHQPKQRAGASIAVAKTDRRRRAAAPGAAASEPAKRRTQRAPKAQAAAAPAVEPAPVETTEQAQPEAGA